MTFNWPIFIGILDYRISTVPLVDAIDGDTYVFSPQAGGDENGHARGAWDWDLLWKRIPLTKRERARQTHVTEPYRSPAMVSLQQKSTVHKSPSGWWTLCDFTKIFLWIGTVWWGSRHLGWGKFRAQLQNLDVPRSNAFCALLPRWTRLSNEGLARKRYTFICKRYFPLLSAFIILQIRQLCWP